MATSEVQTVNSSADKAKLAGAAVLVVGAIVVFYALGKQDLWLRVIALLLVLVLSTWIALATTALVLRVAMKPADPDHDEADRRHG